MLRFFLLFFLVLVWAMGGCSGDFFPFVAVDTADTSSSDPGLDTNSDVDSDTNSDTSTNSDTETEIRFTIEEQTPGFCYVDRGFIESLYDGYTGIGYVNTVEAVGPSVEWAVNATGGTGTIEWRYAAVDDRPASLLINGIEVGTVSFLSPGPSWFTWTTTDPVTAELGSGNNSIRLTA